MVLAAARRTLGDSPDAEDAAQAAFTALAVKAGKLVSSADVGAWLHRAVRFAAVDLVRARRTRRKHEREAAAMRSTKSAPREREADWQAIRPRLDAELDRLPSGQRRVLVACYLQGLSQSEAAERLGMPEGTVAVYCRRGLERLRRRLSGRRGRTLGAAALGALLLDRSSRAAELTESFLLSTVAAATSAAAGAPPAALTEGVLRAMLRAKLKTASKYLSAAAAAALLISASPFALRALGGGPAAVPEGATAPVTPAPPGPQPRQRLADMVGRTVEPVTPPEAPAPAPAPMPVEPREAAPAPASEKPASDTEKAQAATGINALAVDLYKQLIREKDRAGKNVFFSPYSISTALAMTWAGAKGNTAAEMQKALHYTLADARQHAAMGGMTGDLNQAGGEGAFKLSVANALWGQKDYGFLASFVDLNQKYYGAGLERLDFKKDTENSRLTINRWVEKKTQDRIKDLIAKGVLTPDIRLVLTNAIYFKADWVRPFKKRVTRDRAFSTAAGASVKTPTMAQRGYFNYTENDTLQALEMDYKGNRTSMVVLLPRKADGLGDLEKSLSREGLTTTIASLKNREVDVRFPKFEHTCEFKLKPVLKALGIKDAFVYGPADFSGMDGSRNLFIAAVVHKAFVKTDEKGTEAAAATAVMMAAGCVPQPVPVFKADHPFLYVIRDKVTGAVLFMGRVTDPTKK
jgi:serpin B